MGRAWAAFRPANAYRIMDELYNSQERRHAWRKRRAHELRVQRHRPEYGSPLSTDESSKPHTPAAPELPDEQGHQHRGRIARGGGSRRRLGHDDGSSACPATLRNLQNLVEISVDKNTTVIFPTP
jgi:hypothetical protein